MSDLVQIGRSSTAGQTDFVYERLDGPGGLHLYLDGNQKVSGWNPRSNAFSLVEIQDCPFRTPSCEAACYVHGLKKARPDVHALYEHNSRVAHEIVYRAQVHGGALLFVRELAAWIEANCRATGFRWHVSGDIFGPTYARWISEVVAFSPCVQHWIYTRSFPYVHPLLGLPNLSLNFSADKDNLWLAQRYREMYRGKPRICYLTSDGTVPELPPGSVVFCDYNLRAPKGSSPSDARVDSDWWNALTSEQKQMVCPADFYSKAEGRRCSLPGQGGCSKCLT